MQSYLDYALEVYLGDVDTHEVEGDTSVTLSGEAKDNRTSLNLEDGARLVKCIEPGVLKAERIFLLVRYHSVDAYEEEHIRVHQVAHNDCYECYG